MWFFKKTKYVNDDELLAEFKKTGNKELFAELFKLHVKTVYGTCLFYLQDKASAEDATMHIFEKLLVEVHKQDIKNFKAWLGFVVRNFCISEIRKNKSLLKKQKNYYEFEFEQPTIEEEENIASVSDDDMLQQMKPCLLKLKEPQRICIELFYLQNKSYQEIVSETPYSINEVKSYIQNGKRNLKLLLQEINP